MVNEVFLIAASSRCAPAALGAVRTFRSVKMREVLGINPIDIRQSIIDTCYSLIESGTVPRRSGVKDHNKVEGDATSQKN